VLRFIVYVFISVPANSSVKIIGNILLTIFETGKTQDVTVYVWGLILSQLGFYPLLTACLSFIRKWYSVPLNESDNQDINMAN
jgi:hypothetical protein